MKNLHAYLLNNKCLLSMLLLVLLHFFPSELQSYLLCILEPHDDGDDDDDDGDDVDDVMHQMFQLRKKGKKREGKKIPSYKTNSDFKYRKSNVLNE